MFAEKVVRQRDEALASLREVREIAVRNATDCQHLRRSAVVLEKEREDAVRLLRRACGILAADLNSNTSQSVAEEIEEFLRGRGWR